MKDAFGDELVVGDCVIFNLSGHLAKGVITGEEKGKIVILHSSGETRTKNSPIVCRDSEYGTLNPGDLRLMKRYYLRAQIDRLKERLEYVNSNIRFFGDYYSNHSANLQQKIDDLEKKVTELFI